MYKRQEKPLVPDLPVKEAARALGIDEVTLKRGLIQGLFPWGVAIKTDGNRYRYLINRTRFEEHERVVLPQ